MFCPNCESEFRPGFDRCAACDVALVESLQPAAEQPIPAGVPSYVEMADYCGYLDLTEVRAIRDRLEGTEIACEIAIRATPGARAAESEEFWLRIDVSRMKEVVALLESPTNDPNALSCSKCGQPVREEESFCANCGTRFS